MRLVKALLFTMALSLAVSVPAWAGPGGYEVGQVTKIADGDTITVNIRGQKVRVRLYGIDCPEKGQEYGPEATKALKRLIRVGDTVEVRERDRDRYGRSVAWVFAGGANVNEAMVRAGAAWMYTKYCLERKPCAVLFGLQEEARAASRGLWAAPSPLPPWEWRRNN